MAPEKDGRGLFEIIAINKETDALVFTERIVSDGESEALFDSTLKESLAALSLKKDEVHLIVKEISAVPPREDVRKVRVLGNIGGTALVREEKTK